MKMFSNRQGRSSPHISIKKQEKMSICCNANGGCLLYVTIAELQTRVNFFVHGYVIMFLTLTVASSDWSGWLGRL